ncbi:MAG: helix-turn-helix domain-containing protein [Pseudomonadota bacterium]
MRNTATELISDKEVARLLGIGRSSVWRHVRNGKIPKPIKWAGTTRWNRKAIEDWIFDHEAV